MSGPTRIFAQGLKKVFNRRVIFQDLSFTLENPGTLLITGRNGSGKSTLVKIVCGLLTPSGGSVNLGLPKDCSERQRLAQIGMVAPYLQVYDEFSAEENLELALSIRGFRSDRFPIGEVLALVGLAHRKNDPVRAYSSGMKQRVKYAAALVHRPAILVLDEPMANLDTDGIRMVRDVMSEHRRRGMLVVATNDLTDVEQYDLQVNLDERPGR